MSFYNQLNEKGVEPKIKMPQNTFFVLTDEPVVARVIENLISNAVVYMHGDFSITLEEKGSKVILTISNDT